MAGNVSPPDRDTADTLRTLAQSDYWRNQPAGRIARMEATGESASLPQACRLGLGFGLAIRMEGFVKLWYISQTQNDGYDTFDSAIVAAATESDAKAIHPYGDMSSWESPYPTWCRSPDQVTAKLIGEAIAGTEPGVILASFNAG